MQLAARSLVALSKHEATLSSHKHHTLATNDTNQRAERSSSLNGFITTLCRAFCWFFARWEGDRRVAIIKLWKLQSAAFSRDNRRADPRMSISRCYVPIFTTVTITYGPRSIYPRTGLLLLFRSKNCRRSAICIQHASCLRSRSDCAIHKGVNNKLGT